MTSLQNIVAYITKDRIELFEKKDQTKEMRENYILVQIFTDELQQKLTEISFSFYNQNTQIQEKNKWTIDLSPLQQLLNQERLLTDYIQSYISNRRFYHDNKFFQENNIIYSFTQGRLTKQHSLNMIVFFLSTLYGINKTMELSSSNSVQKDIKQMKQLFEPLEPVISGNLISIDILNFASIYLPTLEILGDKVNFNLIKTCYNFFGISEMSGFLPNGEKLDNNLAYYICNLTFYKNIHNKNKETEREAINTNLTKDIIIREKTEIEQLVRKNKQEMEELMNKGLSMMASLSLTIVDDINETKELAIKRIDTLTDLEPFEVEFKNKIVSIGSSTIERIKETDKNSQKLGLELENKLKKSMDETNKKISDFIDKVFVELEGMAKDNSNNLEKKVNTYLKIVEEETENAKVKLRIIDDNLQNVANYRKYVDDKITLNSNELKSNIDKTLQKFSVEFSEFVVERIGKLEEEFKE